MRSSLFKSIHSFVTSLNNSDATCVLHWVGRAFYEAGLAWKAAGQLNMAFVMMNRYLDLADAVEEGTQMLENADFADTDVPYDAQLPDHAYVGESEREEVSFRQYMPEAC
jgi:intraflagellar transport protein 172